MARSHFDTFLTEATVAVPALDVTLDCDRLYGLYVSWCFINQEPLGDEAAFWDAMRDHITTDNGGLRMTGPAAADYILSSYPELP